MDERIQMLSQVPGLWDMEPDELQALSQLFDLRYYDNRVLCKEGDKAETLWVLGQGCIQVIKEVSHKGAFLVSELGPTCMVGHSGVMSIANRTATLKAKGMVAVLEMRIETAKTLLDTAEFGIASPFRRALIVAMSRQLGMATATVGRLANEAGIAELVDVEARLLRAEVSG
jgi:CRP-like cAMP-binding protein